MTAVVIPVTRSPALDRVRGVAIALMIGDHLCAVLGHGLGYRYTLGRVAMPLFFLLSGHLCKRFTRRTAYIGILGLLLPAVVQWIDTPNVLFLYAVGAFLLTSRYTRTIPPLTYVIVALILSANHWDYNAHGFSMSAVIAIMAVGKTLPRSIGERFGSQIPDIFSRIGRYPVSIYVGHLLLLTVVFK